MAMARPMAGLPSTRNIGAGGSSYPRRDLGDVGEAEEAVVHPQVEVLEGGLGGEGAADPQRDALRARLHDPGGRDRVLGLERLDQRLEVEAVARELAGREIEVDRLGLGADQLRLADIGDLEHLRADGLDVVAQLPMRQTIRREGVDVSVDVAELVVEERPLHALRKLASDVAEPLAHLIERRLGLSLLQRVAELHENRGGAGRGVAADEIEAVELLEFLLDPVGDLIEGVLDGRARPRRLHDHGLDRERRILLAAEAPVGHHAGDQRHQHQKPDERAVLERPIGEIETLHA